MRKDPCPYCSHPSLEKIKHPSPNRSQHRPQAKINDLHDGIRQLDAAAVKLSRQRTEFVRELNAVQPPISILPAETLSFIFQLACPPSPSGLRRSVREGLTDTSHWYHTYSVLGHVSVYWRQILLSTPQIWARVSLYISDGTVESEATFLSHFLDRSGSLPLTLSLIYDNQFEIHDHALLHHTVDTQLLENLPRIRNLYLTDPPPGWRSRCLIHLVQLADLSLENTILKEEHPGFSLAHCPNLQSLGLTVVNSPIILPPSCLVTVLYVTEVPIGIFLDLLIHCPNLVKIQAYLILHHSFGPAQLPKEIIVLERLEILDMQMPDVDWEWQDAFLNYIRLPSLRTLCWVHSFDYPWENTISLGTFFSNLSLNLTSLELDICPDSDDLIPVIRYIHDSTGIEHLTFKGCEPSFSQGVLQQLVVRGGGNLRFPRLRKITLDGFNTTYGQPSGQDTDREFSLLLRQMLETRMKNSSELFTLELRNLSPLDGFPLVQRTLARLQDRGYKLKVIVEPGRPGHYW